MGTITILEETTKKPLTLMGRRAGVCWGADIADDDKNYKRGLDCLISGHGRVMEYVNVEMIIDGYSARVIREWYTHLGGSPTRLQASTRYINYNNFSYITPPQIMDNKEALQRYDKMMKDICETCSYLEKECGIPREDAALLLPLGMTTKIVDKRNLRNLVDMSRQRMCSRAYWEYRRMFSDICQALSEVSEEWEYIVKNWFLPKCEMSGFCTEKKSCGRKPKKEETSPLEAVENSC
ncbi:MAG: FAD-dependent thymidylate synthase [Lachnospiraceae bacterium]|nr:FAD-dependent thymidylate synthase [Lachnospiraceae bacterium]